MLVSLAEPNYDRVSPVCPAKLLTVWHTNGVLVWAGVWSKRADKSVISHSKNMGLWSYVSTSFLLHIVSLWNALLHTFTSLTKNFVISYLRHCHSILYWCSLKFCLLFCMGVKLGC